MYTIIANSCNWCCCSRLCASYYVSRVPVSQQRLYEQVQCCQHSYLSTIIYDVMVRTRTREDVEGVVNPRKWVGILPGHGLPVEFQIVHTKLVTAIFSFGPVQSVQPRGYVRVESRFPQCHPEGPSAFPSGIQATSR